jgi:membrane AbrB-like protein
VPGSALRSFPFARFGFALLIGAAGGTTFYLIGLPLPFMLGSMTACMAAAMAQLPVQAPIAIRPPMTAIIGTMLGASVSPATLAYLPSMVWSMLFLLLYVAVGGGICTLYFHRVVGFDLRTAYFSGMPGGLIDMVTLADEFGAEPRKVAIVHTLRIMVVVFTVPFGVLTLTGATGVSGFNTAVSLADVEAGFLFWFPFGALIGAAIGVLLRLPARFLVGPMLVSGTIHAMGWSDYKLPFELIIVAQVVLGATIGCRFVGTPVRDIVSIAMAAVGSTALLLALAAFFAFLVTRVNSGNFLTFFLGYSPGGLAEIGLLALALQIETSVIAIHHVLRLLTVGFGTQLLIAVGRRIEKRRKNKG